LRQIRETFRNRYKKWEIELPEKLDQYGVITKAGWHFTYIQEKLASGETVIHISSDHRMGGPNAYSIYQDGTTQSIESSQSGYAYDSKIPGDKERKQEIYYSKNRKIGAKHRVIGLGRNLKTSDLTTIISFREYEKEFSFSHESEIYHPNYQSNINFNQIQFKSLTHFFYYWKSQYHEDEDLAKRIINDEKVKLDFTQGVQRKRSFFNVFSNTEYEQLESNSKWNENRLRILLWGSIMKFQQNEKIGNELLKYHENRFIFNNQDNYWGSKSNVLGYVLTHTCYDLYYLKWKEPGDNNR
jgi:predicted NAD-dependent protein-ADP-ribosyltransferase YbiA (DUF1768 family)